jgi:hypothetical protein
VSTWGYYALLGDRRLTRALMDATQGERATVAAQMFLGAQGSTLTLTPDPGALTLAGLTARLAMTMRPAAGALTLAGATPRLAATLRPAAGALTLAGGAAPSIGGDEVHTSRPAGRRPGRRWRR